VFALPGGGIDVLRRPSQRENVKRRDLAARIVKCRSLSPDGE
jgi:hypothetical protein